MPFASATRVGPYEIISTLGSGAMGEVYVARDSRLNRNVALKVINPGSTDDAARRRRFTVEARAASALNHPNIITVHDFGSSEGISYIVSELVDGESLRDLIRRGSVPIPALLKIAIQIAGGLEAAHEAGIVHRDLKPENIMITRDGRVKILDFGLAKPMLSRSPDQEPLDDATFDGLGTEPGLIVGTVGYMSPEQARGETVGFECDQFSLGLILHEMATGHAAFRRDTPMATLMAIANVDRMPFTPGPVAFRLLVERMLSKHPAQRFPSLGEVHERLRKIADGLPSVPESAPPESPAAEEPVEVKSTRRATPAILAALVAFGLGLSCAFLLPRAPARNFSNLRFTPLVENGSLAAFPAISPDGKNVAYSQSVDGLLQIFWKPVQGGSATRLITSSSDCVLPFWSQDGTRVMYISGKALWSASLYGGAAESLIPNVTAADLSRNGQSFALVRDDRVYTGSATSLKPVAAISAVQVKFSPSGEELGAGGPDGISVIHLADGKVRIATRREVSGFAWMPDSSGLVYGNGHLWFSDLRTGRETEMTSGTGHENWPSIDPKGTQAVFSTGSASYQIKAVSLRGGEPGVNLPDRGWSPAWCPLKNEFAYARKDGETYSIQFRDASSGWERPLVQSSTEPLGGIAFSNDGQRIAFTRGDRIWIANLSAAETVRLTRDPASTVETSPSWSSDGSSVFFEAVRNGKPGFWRAHAGGAAEPIAAGPDLDPKMAGQWLAITKSQGHWVGLKTTADRKLAILDLNPENGTVVTRAGLGNIPDSFAFGRAAGFNPIQGFSISPDGRVALTSWLRASSGVWTMGPVLAGNHAVSPR